MNVSRLIRSTLPLILALTSMHVAARTISVTTTADQDGSDTASCSLREAVKAVNTSIAYGGCPAGLYGAENRIQLKAGIYLLKSELVVKKDVLIAGASTYREVGDNFGTTEKNPLTGSDSTRLQPLTTIMPVTGGNIRLINATDASGGLKLSDVILEGGNPSNSDPTENYGGIIHSSASVSLDNVRIRAGQAVRGGAVFLSGRAGLAASDTEFSGNQASETGGAIAMNCYMDGSVSRSVTVIRSSFRSNLAAAGAGVIQLCGNAAMTLQSSTLSQNSSATTSGALHYSDGFGASSVVLALDFVTAAENTGGPVILSSGPYAWALKKTVFAANTAGNCSVSGANPDCTATNPTATDDYYEEENVLVSADLTAFSADGYQLYGGLVGGYLPGLPSPLIDVLATGCEGADQRNLSREDVAECDIGALERLQIAVVDDDGENAFGDDRIAYVQVLENDLYGEDGSAVPIITKPADFSLVDKSSTEITDLSVCKIDRTQESGPRLMVDTTGVVTEQTKPVKCYYQLKDEMGVLFGAVGTVQASISNFKPKVGNDNYLRPVGVSSIQLNLLANDDDSGDGIYATLRENFTIMIRGERPLSGVGVKTQLGTVTGEEVDCADVVGDAVDGAVCFVSGMLTYKADNSASPFTEEFEYSVYDRHAGEDALESARAVVTISTDAPDPDKKGGTVDWLLLSLLSLAGLRLSRRL